MREKACRDRKIRMKWYESAMGEESGEDRGDQYDICLILIRDFPISFKNLESWNMLYQVIANPVHFVIQSFNGH